MKVLNNVLAALDASPNAPVVLQAAQLMASRFDAALHGLRVVYLPKDVPESILRLRPEEVELKLAEQARESFDHFLEGTPNVEKRVEIGVPWDVICRVAKEERDSMVVIGSHGFQFLDRLLGTTAARVINHAPCTVLVARPQPSLAEGVERVLVGLDDSPRTEHVFAAAVEAARKLARKGKTVELTAVRIVQVPDFPERVLDPGTPLAESLEAHARQGLDGVLATAPDGLVLRSIVAHGRPWKVLVDAAEETKADLVVVGTHGYDAIDHVIGTTAARVADRATCSVMVVR